MNSLRKHLQTDWTSMTVNDWIGLIATVVIFILMAGLYIYVWRPGNREKMEAHRNMVLNEDSREKEDNNE